VARKLQPALGCAFYRSETGAEPVRAWLRSLDPAVRLEIGSDVEKVQWRWPVSKPLVGAFGSGLYEVRTALEGNIYRVFFCIAGDTMVLLHGFMKKTQKAPAKEVDLARARQKEVQRP
jgi:phage-related protein